MHFGRLIHDKKYILKIYDKHFGYYDSVISTSTINFL